jgi:hypothetical protein
MLQVVKTTPSGEGREVRPSMVGKSRKRKPWEFTWDDTIDGAGPVIESLRAMPERRARKRKAWEFTWDDQDGSGLSAVSSSVIRQEAPLQSVETSLNSSSASSSVLDADGCRLRPHQTSLHSSTDAKDSSSPDSMNSESMDIGRVRRQLLSMGQSVVDRKSPSLQEDVSWIRPRRARHEVQVVHVRPSNKHHHRSEGIQETTNRKNFDSSLRTHPLIENALNILSILRSSQKEENVNALRQAVRVLRQQVAGLEAQAYAYAKPFRSQIPLFKQVYDPKTKTG